MQINEAWMACGELQTHARKRHNVVVLSLCFLGGLMVVALLQYSPWQDGIETPASLSGLLVCTAGLLSLLAFGRNERRRLRAFVDQEQHIAQAMAVREAHPLKCAIDELVEAQMPSQQGKAYLDIWLPILQHRLERLLDKEAKEQRKARIEQLCRQADQMVKAAIRRRHEALPEVRARMRLEEEIPHLRRLVEEADKQFKAGLDKRKLKWWLMLTRDRSSLEEVERQIAALETALAKVVTSPTLIAAEEQFLEFNAIVDRRVLKAKTVAIQAVPDSRDTPFEPDHALAAGLIAGAAAGADSLVNDLRGAGSIYASLREVNGRFADFSNFEIWQETLAMPSESLIGLASLTKGAYFEKLVEQDFGGERFENFNHPDTDIVIDGVEIQIKATDSVSYINSVADHIPVIATSEVAEKTDAIDGGFSNEELSEAIDLALGGTVVDIGDAVLDGLTTGLGGVGIVAILSGSHSAWKSYQRSGNAIEALGTGLQTTAARTARSTVNLVEMAYRGSAAVVMSKPVKVVSGAIRSGLEAANRKASEALEKQARADIRGSTRSPSDVPSG